MATPSPTFSSPSSPTTSLTADPTTPAYNDSLTWISAYLTIHSLSQPSYRYLYLTWFSILLVFLLFALFHLTSSRGGYLGALFSKFSLRRRTWRKKYTLTIAKINGQPHKQPYSLPSNAQILSLVVLFVGVALLCSLGADYIAPEVGTWDFSPNAAPSVYKRKRDTFDPSSVSQYIPQYTIYKSWWTSSARTGDIAYALLPLCILFALKSPPFAIFALPFMIQLHFDKLVRLHRWTGRAIWLVTAAHVGMWSVQLSLDKRSGTGEIAWKFAFLYNKFIFGWIAFVLLTLIIAFSILPMRTSHYDVFYFLHVLLVPLMIITAALHHPPIWWWCWAALGLWVGERIWRGTWWVYVNGVFFSSSSASNSTSATSNFNGMGASRNTYPNTIGDGQNIGLGIMPYQMTVTQEKRVSGGKLVKRKSGGEAWEMNGVRPYNQTGIDLESQAHTPYGHSTSTLASPSTTSPSPFSPVAPSSRTLLSQPTPNPNSPANNRMSVFAPSDPDSSYTPPPGYAHIVLLPGHTVRLRLITPGYLSWAPGQHFLLYIPHLSLFKSHPFTAASISDELEGGCELVFIIRAKSGWTARLFETVRDMIALGDAIPSSSSLPPNSTLPPPPIGGVLLRTFIDGPFGSAARAKWGAYSTALIVCGGSGVSFGVSVLQYLCLCLAGRDGRTLGGRAGGWGTKGFKVKRVRFVWLVREYAHLQWCASALRRCSDLIPNESLEINIFVSNFQPVVTPLPTPTTPTRNHMSLPPNASSPPSKRESKRPDLAELDTVNIDIEDVDLDEDLELAPPMRPFAPSHRQSGSGSRGGSSRGSFSTAFNSSHSSVDLSYYFNDAPPDSINERDGELGYEEHMLDYTNFDGDNDTALPGENRISLRVQRQSFLSQRLSTMSGVSGLRKLGNAMLEKTHGHGKGSKLKESVHVAGGTGIMEKEGESGNESERESKRDKEKQRRSKYKSNGKSSNRASVQSTDRLLATPGASPISPDDDESGHAHNDSGGWLARALDDDDTDDEPTPTYDSFSHHHHTHSLPPLSLPPAPFQAQQLYSDDHQHRPHASTSAIAFSASQPPPPPSSSRGASSSAITLVGHDQSSTPRSPPAHPAVHFSLPQIQTQIQTDSPGSYPPPPQDVPISMTRQEARDLKVISEFARPGRPKFARILADEVEQSRGQIVVACCGPTSLNALMRKTISAQIDPQRILKGDMRGSIALVSEDFEY